MTSGKAFAAASVPIVFTVAFFWIADRVTELTIPAIGTIRAAVDTATKYVEEIKGIRSELEKQKQEVADAVAALKKDIAEANAQVQELKARHITEEQRKALIQLLSPTTVPKAPVYFNPVDDERRSLAVQR